MSNDLIAIKGDSLPAHLRGKGPVANPFAAAVSTGGFPIISIKGKVFHISRSGELELVARHDDPESPASYLDVVIMAVNPGKSKIYYSQGYVEGSTEKPDCYSNSGIKPELDAETPQCKTCAACPHNQWGSRISESGAKAKSCTDAMRIAVAAGDMVNDPMLLRVPAVSLKQLGEYGKQLALRGCAPHHVITRIRFDNDVAFPSLKFKAVSFVDAEELAEIEAVQEEAAELITNIIGTSANAGPAPEPTRAAPVVDETKADPEDEEAADPVDAPPRRKRTTVAKKPAPVVEDEEFDGDEDEPPAVNPRTRKASAKVETISDYDSVTQALTEGDFDFDDEDEE